MSLTNLEKNLNELIHKTEDNINDLSSDKTKKLLNVLMLVSSISQDDNLDNLTELLTTNFREYGK